MLLGRRLLILVQSDNPTIQFGRLGGVPALWNHREWLNKSIAPGKAILFMGA
jgi:hypothetical protein